MPHKTYRAKVVTTHTRGIVPQGFEAPFPDAAPPDPAIWEPVDGVWPEVKRAAPPHWSDTPPDEVVVALRVFQTPEEFLRVLSMGVAFANGVKADATEQAPAVGEDAMPEVKANPANAESPAHAPAPPEAAPATPQGTPAPAPESTGQPAAQPVPGKVGKATSGKPANTAKPQG